VAKLRGTGRSLALCVLTALLLAFVGGADRPAIAACDNACKVCETCGSWPAICGEYCADSNGQSGRCDCSEDSIVLIGGKILARCELSGEFCFGIIVP